MVGPPIHRQPSMPNVGTMPQPVGLQPTATVGSFGEIEDMQVQVGHAKNQNYPTPHYQNAPLAENPIGGYNNGPV
jgi:hypothetical protein